MHPWRDRNEWITVPSILRTLEAYSDDAGNEIIYAGPAITQRLDIRFHGRGNKLVVAANAKIVELSIEFGGDDGVVEILPTSQPRTGLRFGMRVGHNSRIRIGENVGSQSKTMVTAVEETEVIIGDDCMIAEYSRF